MAGYVKFPTGYGETSEAERTPTKVAKAAKVSSDSQAFSRFSDFSSTSPEKAKSDHLTVEARRAWSDELCRRLSEDVARQSPAGLGHWDNAWEIVEAPSARLLDALAEWERTGDAADQSAACQAAEDVGRAWRTQRESGNGPGGRNRIRQSNGEPLGVGPLPI